MRFVHDPAASKQVFTWDILFTGIVGAKGVFFLSDFGMIVIPPRLKVIVEDGICSIYRTQKKNSKEIRRLLRYKSAEVFAFVQNVIEDYESLHVKNSEGDPLLFSTLHYRIEDPVLFLEIIKKTSIFIQDHDRILIPGNPGQGGVYLGEEGQEEKPLLGKRYAGHHPGGGGPPESQMQFPLPGREAQGDPGRCLREMPELRMHRFRGPEILTAGNAGAPYG